MKRDMDLVRLILMEIEEKYDMVLPSFWGSTGIMLVAGGILYGIFLIFALSFSKSL